MSINVELPVFDGPLDLLLHLIDKNKINILFSYYFYRFHKSFITWIRLYSAKFKYCSTFKSC